MVLCFVGQWQWQCLSWFSLWIVPDLATPRSWGPAHILLHTGHLNTVMYFLWTFQDDIFANEKDIDVRKLSFHFQTFFTITISFSFLKANIRIIYLCKTHSVCPLYCVHSYSFWPIWTVFDHPPRPPRTGFRLPRWLERYQRVKMTSPRSRQTFGLAGWHFGI